MYEYRDSEAVGTTKLDTNEDGCARKAVGIAKRNNCSNFMISPRFGSTSTRMFLPS